jgi:hypothetical protein
MVFFGIPQSSANAALGCAGMGTGGVKLAQDRRFRGARGIQSSHQASSASANNDYIELMFIHAASP